MVLGAVAAKAAPLVATRLAGAVALQGVKKVARPRLARGAGVTVPVVGVPALSTESIGSDQHLLQLDPVQWRGERRNVLGLPVDLGLAEYDAAGVA